MKYNEMIYEKTIQLTNEFMNRNCGLIIEQAFLPIKTNNDFDIGKYVKWLFKTNVSYTSNPIAYLAKAFTERNDKHAFDTDLNFTELLFVLKDLGAANSAEERRNIKAINWYFIHALMTEPSEMTNINHAAIVHMEETGNTSNEEYIRCLSKSKFGINKHFKVEEYEITKEVIKYEEKRYKEYLKAVEELNKI